MPEAPAPGAQLTFREVDWRLSYRTSEIRPDGRPVDILHDFYLPVLARAVRYDRVAGYFRSSSLAAASQGFTAFAAAGGRARFVVGADLDPRDVAVILQHGGASLSEHLLPSLAGPEQWPEPERHGVALLAHLLAHGHLDIRVALRVHRKTHEPLPLDAVTDGYVHEKWAILEDRHGDGIYLAGSLNESRTALTLNAENIDVHCAWRGEDNARRLAEAQVSFDALWDNRHPAFRVLGLPEAVRERLITLAERFAPAEIDATPLHPTAPEPDARERLLFAMLRDGPRLPGGEQVGLVTAPVAPWPHQAIVARRLVRQFPASHLLCDEVGLGKTIEAGLAIRALHLSGLARRMVIAAPASLTRQWQRELAEKFLLPFARLSSAPNRSHEILDPATGEVRSFTTATVCEPERLILSTGLLARKQRGFQIPDSDLILVDEAHYARRQNPGDGVRGAPRFGNLYRTLEEHLRPRTRCLLLATATPMQLHPVEVSDLLRLIPRLGPFQLDPSLTQAYYDVLDLLRRRESLRPTQWTLLRESLRGIQDLDPGYWRTVTTTVLEPRLERTLARWLDDDIPPRGRDQEMLLPFLFACAPLSRVMLRHTRGLLETYRDHGHASLRLARREVRLTTCEFTEQEATVYRMLEDYCGELARRLSQAKRGRANTNQAAIGFYLSFLRLRFASSLHAIRQTVERRQARVEQTLAAFETVATDRGQSLDEVDWAELLAGEDDDPTELVEVALKNRSPEDLRWERGELARLGAALDDLSPAASKTQKLLGLLDGRLDRQSGRIRQCVVFTRFADTLKDLFRRLRQPHPGLRLGTYSGEGGSFVDPTTRRIKHVERERIRRRFLAGEIDVLLCTDAAAEGLNLQTADLLVNFDLPWNPMKVEQRIGRIDRIGQRHDQILVVNLCYPGSLEERVYGRLLERLRQAGAIVGMQQLSLLPVTPEDFEALAEGRLSDEALFEKAHRAIQESRRQAQRLEISDRERLAAYTRELAEAAAEAPPVTLETLWTALRDSAYLQALGCRLDSHEGEEMLWLAGIPGINPDTALTVSRPLFERGLPAGHGTLRFASYGDPVFEALLAHLTGFALPAGVVRLTTPLGDAERVGYALQLADGAPRLLTRPDEIPATGLPMTEPAVADTDALAAELARRVQPLATAMTGVSNAEAQNRRVAESQLALEGLVISALMQARARFGTGEEQFRKEAEAIERKYEQDTYRHEGVKLTTLDGELVGRLAQRGLPYRLPSGRGEVTFIADPLLIFVSLDLAWRVADGLRGSRKQRSTQEVIEAMRREARRYLAK